MEKLYKLLVFALTLSIISSCGDEFLKLIPESEYSAEGGYKTPQDFELAIAGVYARQLILYRANDCWFRHTIFRSDDMRGNYDSYLNGVKNFTDTDNVTTLYNGWNNMYIMINRANIILDKIEGITFPDAVAKNNIKGEALALRGWCYWNLGWQFGGVPLITRELTLEEVKATMRSSQEETLKQAQEDLSAAIGLLPDAWSAKYAGRVTKYAAAALSARICLFQRKFSEAKPLLESIITSGKYALAAKYEDCFSEKFDNSAERVWEVQFTGGQLGVGSIFISGIIPEGYQGNLTNDKVSPIGGGYSTAGPVNKLLVEAYEPNDLRRSLSLLENPIINGTLDTVSVYIWKYFLNEGGYVPKDKNDWANNLPIVRYTDVLCMYAEVLNEEEYVPDGEAFGILNSIRRRAGINPLTSVEVPDQASFRQAIINERRVEFAFEGLRWVDMIRWGIAKEMTNLSLNEADQGGGRFQMKDYQVLFAIPGEELRRFNDTKILWQNPGY